MKNQYKEIENQLRKSLEFWSDVMTESNDNGWGIELDFSNEDVFNAVNIMNTICCNVAIKNGSVATEKDADKVGENLKHLLNVCFGIDFEKFSENEKN